LVRAMMTEMSGPLSTTPRDIVVNLVRWVKLRHGGILLKRDGLLRHLDGGISGQSLRTSIIPASIGRSRNMSSWLLQREI
jgi:hypothetical protein